MSSDQGSSSDNRSLISLPGRLIDKLTAPAPVSGAVAGIGTENAPGYGLSPVSAAHSSVAIGRDNKGLLVNAAENARVNVIIEHRVQQELPSHLSNVVVALSGDLVGYGTEARRELLPEVADKLTYNDFPARHPIITDYTMHSGSLEAAYRGVEQRNGDARRMVRRRAASVYQEALLDLCESKDVHHSQAHGLARKYAVSLVRTVIDTLKKESVAASLASGVMRETADLAISLIVADAIVECEVLERPDDATAA
ncbi:MAG TPA: hypothetical protein VGE47_00725 [Burkholderiaceae bacterium]